MIDAYPTYAKDVGVVIPRGEAYANSASHMIPPINAKDMVTISLKQMIPGYNNTARSAQQPQT
jgi:hypothetical protein